MSIPKGRRAWAVQRRVRPHEPIEDDAGCCTVCNVPTAAKNALHLAKAPPEVEAARDLEDRQRLT